MKRMQRLRARIGSALDVPLEAIGEQMCISTSGFWDTTVDGCSAIVDYSPSHVILDCGDDRVVIEGSGLRVSVFAMSRVRIHGKISSITNGEVRE